MPFRYRRSIRIAKGASMTVSNSGVSASIKTPVGRIGTRGFSLRTGIPGLTYTSGWAKKQQWDGLLLLTVVFSVIILVGWNVVRLIFFLIRSAYNRMNGTP